MVFSARGTPDQQAVTTGNFSTQFQELLKAGLTLAGASKKKEGREEMLGYLRTTSINSSKLLVAAKALHVDPNGPNVQNQLAAAARACDRFYQCLVEFVFYFWSWSEGM